MPVFVVGMPRSGTSLVEQIAASHSRVSGAGELADISHISAEIQRLQEHGAKKPTRVWRIGWRMNISNA